LIALQLMAHGPETYPLVKASITGSIIGNTLLVLGMAILFGGLFHRRQTFNRTYASMGATLLALASIGLIVPTLYHFLPRLAGTVETPDDRIINLSEEIAAVLAVIYVLSLLFSLSTGRGLFGEGEKETAAEPSVPGGLSWPVATLILIMATAGVAWMTELLAGSVEEASQSLGLNPIFMGVIVLAIVGNAAEHSTAVVMAIKNKMDLAMHIAIGSAIQIALFVAPVLVFASLFINPAAPLDLHFTLLETVTVLLAVAVLALVCVDGESNWMEGAMLLGVYVILGLAFYNLPLPSP
jgi:Ca2+:H+ antiporter